ncbi:MAG: MFS transporter [Ginsengibacter sp.]
MTTTTNKRNYYIVFLIMLIFFVISFLTNVIGALIPDIKTGFGLSLTEVAILPFAFFIAYGVMSIPAGMLNEKYKEKKIMVAAFVVSFAGALLLVLFPNYSSYIVSLFLIGCGMAMLQVVINPLLRTSGGEENYAFNSVFAQLIFGAASFISPLVYSYLVLNLANTGAEDPVQKIFSSIVPKSLPWISLYWLFALVSLIMIVVIIVSKFPKVLLTKDEKAGALSGRCERSSVHHAKRKPRPVTQAGFKRIGWGDYFASAMHFLTKLVFAAPASFLSAAA